MRPTVAIEELAKLKDEAEAADFVGRSQDFQAWQARVRMIFVRALGEPKSTIENY